MRTFIKTLLLPLTFPIVILFFCIAKLAHFIAFVFDDDYNQQITKEVFCVPWGLLPKYFRTSE